jgi:hypothetical protein
MVLPDAGKFTETIQGSVVLGFDYAIAYYSDENLVPVEKSKATRAEVVKYMDGIIVERVYAKLTPKS